VVAVVQVQVQVAQEAQAAVVLEDTQAPNGLIAVFLILVLVVVQAHGLLMVALKVLLVLF
tara:strand:- start:19 stop:198 length:180 start_codon:yes stop_codon:yes gene_type:complete